LILIHPPPRQAERRCSSGDGRVAPFDAVELIACRSSEADRRAMPPEECRSEGTPSLSEGPDVRGERFLGYFFKALVKKVSRRKGETASRRHSKNGYVHSQKKDRLTIRPHSQAFQALATTHVVRQDLFMSAQTSLSTTLMLLRVAFEYGQYWCPVSTIFCAVSRSSPGRLTLSRAWSR